MKKRILTLSFGLIATFALLGCGGGNSTTNPNTGAVTPVANGDFVGLGQESSGNGFIIGHSRDWQFTIDSQNNTFSATESINGVAISGDLNSTSDFLQFRVTSSNNTLYPVGMTFDGVGIGNSVAFIDLKNNGNSVPEFATLIKKDTCPNNNMDMVWHRFYSPVLVNPWRLNDVVSDLRYDSSSSSFLSSNSWTITNQAPNFAEASFLTYPATLTCNNGKFTATQTLPAQVIRTYKGYIANGGYSVSSNNGWANVELSLPKKAIADVNNLKGNYVGYVIVTPGNAYGFKEEVGTVSAYLDFSNNGAVSSLITLNPNSQNSLEVGYMNITKKPGLNQPIDGQLQGEFNIFTTQNSNHPLLNETMPFADTIITHSVNQALADFRGDITCSAYENLDNSNKSLVVCQGVVAPNLNSNSLMSTQDNLITIILVTGKFIPTQNDIGNFLVIP